MNTEPTTAEKIKKLPWSIARNAANTVFVQFTFFGSAFVLFLSRLGFSKPQIGLLLSLLPYTGLVALFIAPLAARWGYKRTYLTFFGLRKLVTAMLLLTPWVLAGYGFRAMVWYVFAVVFGFALSRAVAETSYYPWAQEYIPSTVMGKFTATNNIFATLVGFLAVSIAGFVIDRVAGLNGFLILIGVGVLFGLLATWLAGHIPGGAPLSPGAGSGAGLKQVFASLKDVDFRLYLFGVGLVTLAITPISSFLPLFMKEQVGIAPGYVVLLQTGTLLGGLLSTYLWGWLADRYGSRPIVLFGATFIALLPLFWIFMPMKSAGSLYAALGIALLQGIANMGWLIGSRRLLFVNVVPAKKRSAYMALYYAWIGLVGGTSQLVGGQLVELARGWAGQFFFVPLHPYLSLFVPGIILPLSGIALLRNIRSDTRLTVEQFAGLFLRGNPFLALAWLVGYHLAKDERTVVAVAERLGQTRSLLTVEELLELLADPRFNVRFEAIISIARMRPDPRLTAALVSVLNGTELALSAVAAWALGRQGDSAATDALRNGLNSRYHSIRAQCARALGTLGDVESAPLFIRRLRAEETDRGVQMAYASALGRLQTTEAADDLLALLKTMENKGARVELALSLVRIAGDEGRFIHLLREARADTGTALAQRMAALHKKFNRIKAENKQPLMEATVACEDAFAENDIRAGAEGLATLINRLPPDYLPASARKIVRGAASEMRRLADTRPEYIFLVVNLLDTGPQPE